jgi:hypothetical protein
VAIDGIGPVNVNGTQTVSPSNSTNFHHHGSQRPRHRARSGRAHSARRGCRRCGRNGIGRGLPPKRRGYFL